MSVQVKHIAIILKSLSWFIWSINTLDRFYRIANYLIANNICKEVFQPDVIFVCARLKMLKWDLRGIGLTHLPQIVSLCWLCLRVRFLFVRQTCLWQGFLVRIYFNHGVHKWLKNHFFEAEKQHWLGLSSGTTSLMSILYTICWSLVCEI